MTQILKADRVEESDVQFLISIGKIDEAEEYILKHADQRDDIYYDSLLSLADAMESEKRYLATSLIYRSLLVSSLEQGYIKAYYYASRYLKKLDDLAVTVSDWKGFSSHESFKMQLKEAPGRKRSFWSKYEGKK